MKAMQVMSALSQATRYDTFRRLVDALPDGMPSGEIAVAVGASPTSMSAHLAILERAGLVDRERSGRAIIYRALPEPVMALSALLARACAP